MIAERIRYESRSGPVPDCRGSSAIGASDRGHSTGRRDEEKPPAIGSGPWSAAEPATSARITHRSSGRKVDALADLRDSVHWHLIGHLQTNKVKKTLPMVRLIHSVDSLKLLRALNDAAPCRHRSAGRLLAGQYVR